MTDEAERIDCLGRAAWPGFTLETTLLAAHVAELAADPEGRAADRLANAADLYLACACAHQVIPAFAAFEALHLSKVDLFVARTDSSPEFAAEVRQHLRDRLLIAEPGAAPRIARYSGRGPLSAWVRMAAVRAAVDLKRAMIGGGGSPERLPDPTDALDPEAQLLKARYFDQYQTALRDAWRSLSARQRSILRLNYVDGHNIEQIGRTYQVHRATVARWILEARQELLRAMMALLAERLGLSQADLSSIANLVVRELHLSMASLPARDHGGDVA